MNIKIKLIIIAIIIGVVIVGYFLISLIPVIMISGVIGDAKSKNKIFSYVNENYELLGKFPYTEIQKNNNKEEKEKFIKEHLGKNTIVQSVYAYNENILQYYCGGSGNVTGSTYTGFYFSKNDTPYAMEFDGCDLNETKPGTFEWQNADGSHKIYTEKIRDNWYYYKLEWY